MGQTRWLTRGRVLGAMVALSLVAAGCGSSSKKSNSASSSGASSSGGSNSAKCANAADATEVKLGGNVAVTGGAANIGSVWKRGLELGVDAANKQGISVGGKCYKLSIDIQDNTTQPQRAIGINQQFLSQGLKFVFGPGVSSLFTPAFESMKGTGTLVMTPATTAIPLLGTPDGKLLFDNHIVDGGDRGRLAAMSSAIVDRYKPTAAAILLPQDAAGDVHVKGFTDGLKAKNVNIVYSQRFDPATNDFAPFIAAIKAKNPDLVIVGYLDKWVQPFLTQAVQAGLTTPVFVGSPGSTFAAAANKPAITKYAISVTTRAVDDPGDPKTKAFRDAWQAKFGSAPGSGDFWALSYYDSVQMLAQAMELSGSVDNTTSIATALHRPEASQYPARALDLTYAANNQALYTPQMGFQENSKTTYQDSPLGG